MANAILNDKDYDIVNVVYHASQGDCAAVRGRRGQRE
jgi:hypothetical protein